MLLIGVVVVLAVSSSCNIVASAATINGQSISLTSFSSILSDYSQVAQLEANSITVTHKGNASNIASINQNAALNCIPLQTNGVPDMTKVYGTNASSYNQAFTACVLDQQVGYSVIESEVSTRKIEPSSSLVSSVKSQLNSGFKSAVGISNFLSTLPSKFATFIIYYNADQININNSFESILSQSTTQNLLRQYPKYTSTVCFQGFPLPDSTTASQYLSAIDRGISFKVAAENGPFASSLQNPIVNIGCGSIFDASSPIVDLVAMSVESNIGQAIGPYANGNYWWVIQVTKRTVTKYTTSLDSQRSSAIKMLSQIELSITLNRLEATAKVNIDPRFGVWFQATPSIYQICPIANWTTVKTKNGNVDTCQ